MDITIGVIEEGIKLTQQIINEVGEFNEESVIVNDICDTAQQVIEVLLNVPGMTQAHSRDFHRSQPILKLKEEILVRIYINPLVVKHIFLANTKGEMIFGGFVGWIHSRGLENAMKILKEQFSPESSHTIESVLTPSKEI
jgi:hypothetical protein